MNMKSLIKHMTLNRILYSGKYPTLALSLTCLWCFSSCSELKESSKEAEHTPEPKELKYAVEN